MTIKLGDTLRLLRVHRNWSQEYVAHELGMSLPGYSKIERNITDVNLSRLTQLAELFSLKSSSLLAMCENPNDPLLPMMLMNNKK